MTRAAATLAATLFLSLMTGAQATLPDTPAARQFGAWLHPFNAGDRDGLQRFLDTVLRDRGPRTVDQDLGFREQTGGFDVMKVEASTPARITGLVRERDGERFARFTIEVEPEPPHRIVQFGLQVAPRPAEFATQRLTEAELIEALRQEARRRAAEGKFSGAVALARNGKTLLTAAHGLADRERAIPNAPDTRFRNGSMNKMLTAVAVLQLAQAGRLRLEDSVGRHLPDYPNEAVASKVTIHHLLTHTGGTGDIFGPQFAAQRLSLRTHADYLRLYGARDLLFEPGLRWSYSNFGYVLLGAIIERASGQSYYDYLHDHVYVPAGMRATGSEPEEQDVPRRAVGYMRRGGAWQPNADTLPYRGTAAGGGYTTVEDLVRFATALQTFTLLDAAHTELLTRGKVEGGPGGYAYGFGDVDAGGVRWIGHNGGAPGMNGDLRIFPDSGYAIAVLANQDPPAADRISEFVTNRLPAR